VVPGQKGMRQIRGWIEPSDPFFEVIDQIVSDRDKHRPRIFKPSVPLTTVFLYTVFLAHFMSESMKHPPPPPAVSAFTVVPDVVAAITALKWYTPIST